MNLKRIALLSITSLVLCGCSGGPKLAPISGTVTLDEKPLAKGTITFESPGNRAASARIENGQIVEATTLEPGDGVPVGSHHVAISAYDDAASAVVANPGETSASGPDYMSGKPLIPAAYNDPTTSGLSAEVKSGEKNILSFKLTSQGP